MRNHETNWSVSTTGARDFIDITERVQSALDECGIRDGHVTLSLQGRSCALIVNELESGLIEDLRRTLDKVGNSADPPLGSRLVTLPASDGRLRLGTWQRVMLVELEGEGERSVAMKVEGE